MLDLVNSSTTDPSVAGWRVWTESRYWKIIWVKTDTGLGESAYAWMHTGEGIDWWTSRCKYKDPNLVTLTIEATEEDRDGFMLEPRGRVYKEEAAARGILSGKSLW
jgi:hypothetical protein